jgi:hypothetical protein
MIPASHEWSMSDPWQLDTKQCADVVYVRSVHSKPFVTSLQASTKCEYHRTCIRMTDDHVYNMILASHG